MCVCLVGDGVSYSRSVNLVRVNILFFVESLKSNLYLFLFQNMSYSEKPADTFSVDLGDIWNESTQEKALNHTTDVVSSWFGDSCLALLILFGATSGCCIALSPFPFPRCHSLCLLRFSQCVFCYSDVVIDWHRYFHF